MTERPHGTWTTDPRADDLTDDSPAWESLLTVAHQYDGDDPAGLFGALHGLRCCGARLTQAETGLRLERGEMSVAEYAAARTMFLMPHARLLRHLLERTAKASETS